MQRVLVTAGASGIGRAMAEAFEASGYRVWVIDIDQTSLDRCPDSWHRDRVNVADAVEMEALFAEISDVWGGLDVVCANAGTSGPTALLEDQSMQGFHDCVAVNLFGAFLTAKGALPMMKQARQGCLIFTSSTAGIFGFPLRSPYSAAKWAINGLMKTVAMEAGPFGIRANSIAPGCVEGDRIDGVIAREAAQKRTTPEAIRMAYAAGTSLQTFVRAEDIANLAVFLASKAGERISGQIIPVDGHTENPDPKVTLSAAS